MRNPHPNFLYVEDLSGATPLLAEIETDPLMKAPLDQLVTAGVVTAADLIRLADEKPDWYEPIKGIGQKRAESLLAKCRNASTPAVSKDPLAAFEAFWTELCRLRGFQRVCLSTVRVVDNHLAVRFFMLKAGAGRYMQRFNIKPLPATERD